MVPLNDYNEVSWIFRIRWSWTYLMIVACMDPERTQASNMWWSVLSIEYRLGSYLGSGNLNWGTTSFGFACEYVWVAFSSLLLDLGGSNPLWVVPSPGRWAWAISYKGSWASKRNQTRKKSPSVASVSVPFTMFLSGVSALAALVCQIESFLLKLVVASFF